MIAAAAAVAVEVGGGNAVRGQILSRGAVLLDGTRRGDVVRSDGVAQHGQAACGSDVFDRSGRGSHAVKVGRLADVGRVLLPAIGVAGGEFEVLPVLVAMGYR